MSMEFLMGVPGKLKKLLDRLTSTRAGYLDNLPRLDTNIASRAPSSTALSNTTWTSARAAKIDNLDASVSSRLSSAVKQVIYGSNTITVPANTSAQVDQSTTIAAVDRDKAIVLLRQSGAGQVTPAGGDYNDATAFVYLVGNTEIKASIDPVKSYSANRDFKVRWILIEFN